MGYRFMRFPDGKPKAVTLSYDDGFWFDVPLSQKLNSYGMKATFNITGAYLCEKRTEKPDLSAVKGKAYNELPITKDEISEYLIGGGHEIALHGYFHRAPGNIRAIDGINDVLKCRVKLETDFKQIIRGMAYPDSGITQFVNSPTYETIRNYLVDLDIAYARTLGADNDRFDLPTDWHAWIPTVYQVNPKLFEYIDKFLSLDINGAYTALRHPRLFYLWGHSFEFYTKFDWNMLDRICEKLSHRKEIWYATNIEIYDYVKAYESLIFSADGHMAYNPTLIELWFDIDGKLYNIKSGEKLIIE